MITKLNIGCGTNYLKGYINIDILAKYKPNIIADVKNLPFEDNYADEILASDVLEHLFVKDIKNTLIHWRNILKTSGKLVIQTPNIETIAKQILTKDLETQNTMVKRIFGSWGNDLADIHKSIFTPLTLSNLLEEIGFKNIKVYPVKDLKTPDYDTNMVIECLK